MKEGLMEQWLEFGGKTKRSFERINALHSSSIKQLSELQMEVVASCFEASVEEARRVSAARSVSELLDLQSSLYQELSKKMLDNAQNTLQIAMDSKRAMNVLLAEAVLSEAPDSEVLTPSMNTPVEPKRPTRRVTSKPKVKPASKKVVAKAVVKKTTPRQSVNKGHVKKPVSQKDIDKSGVKLTRSDGKN